jgi:hypothetical protein
MFRFNAVDVSGVRVRVPVRARFEDTVDYNGSLAQYGPASASCAHIDVQESLRKTAAPPYRPPRPRPRPRPPEKGEIEYGGLPVEHFLVLQPISLNQCAPHRIWQLAIDLAPDGLDANGQCTLYLAARTTRSYRRVDLRGLRGYAIPFAFAARSPPMQSAHSIAFIKNTQIDARLNADTFTDHCPPRFFIPHGGGFSARASERNHAVPPGR